MNRLAAGERRFRFGVLGLGLMGKRHCRLITHLPDCVLAGVCDNDGDAARTLALEFNAKSFDSADALFSYDGIDGVVICLPSALHAEYGILAAQAGKHIVMEKPIDSRSEKARELLAACEVAGVGCFVINQYRYSAGLAALKLAVSEGVMGEPLLARATVKWFRHDEYYTGSNWRGRLKGEHGGVLMNQAIHSIDTLQWLFGRPDDVAGFCSNSRPAVVEAEDSAVAIMRWKSGLVASLEASTSAAPGFEEAYEVQSAVASARVEKGVLTHWYHADGRKAPQPDLMECPAELDAKLCNFYRQYCDILSCLRGGQADLNAAHLAVQVVETVERIYGSAEAFGAVASTGDKV